MVFQILLDLLQARHHDGYVFGRDAPGPALVVSTPAFADDLAIVSSSVQGNQLALSVTEAFCLFTKGAPKLDPEVTAPLPPFRGGMSCKPSKCWSLGLAYRPAPLGGTSFQPFDPQLSIHGETLRYLGVVFFKFLGRKIFASLSEQPQADALSKYLDDSLNLIDGLPISGPSKAWLYQHYVVPFTTWPFMVYDFPLSFAEELTTTCTASLKRWYGIARPSEISILYRSRSRHGLGLSSLVSHFKAMKVCKAHLAKHSPDPAMRTLHSLKLRSAKDSPRWGRVGNG